MAVSISSYLAIFVVRRLASRFRIVAGFQQLHVWNDEKRLETTWKMATKHISASAVISPKAHWGLIDVLDDQGAEDVAIALGRWDQQPVLAMRWNGGAGNPIGNPQSRGLPTWFILPAGEISEAIIRLLPSEKQALVRNFIPKPTR